MTKYKYNDDSIIAGYIRELLHDFNLPAYKVYKGLTKNGYGLYDGRRYINDGYIVAYDQYKKEDGKVGGFNRI